MSEIAADFDSVAALYDRQCAAEQIHLLGGVQPHGFVLVVDLGSGLIVQVSSGVTRHWPGIGHCQLLLGTALASWLDSAHSPDLGSLQDLPDHSPALLRLALRSLTPDGVTAGIAPVLQGFECMGHAVGAHAVLEWIATSARHTSLEHESREIQKLNMVLSKLRQAKNLDDYFRDCVVQLQSMSGYDRVMLYRFLPDWSGEIVAEHTGPGFEPKYKGLRFPATDIPPQARRLYESNTLRMLNDTESTPDALVPQRLPDGAPLDQSHSLLRSLSTVHQTYLRHMGVRATMVISLLVDGKLWGLLTCHHHQPWVLPHDTRHHMRSSCELMANVVGTRIEDLTRLERRRQSEVHVRVLADLRAGLDLEGTIEAAVARQSDSLCQAFDAMGWGLRMGSVSHVGSSGADAASGPALLAEVALLAADLAPGAVCQIADLGERVPTGLATAPDAAGILIARLPAGQDGLCFFLRPELVREVDWAGDPDKLTLVSGAGEPRLEPRRSFALWKQSRRGCARRWSAADEDAAASLAAMLGAAYKDQLNLDLQRELDWRAHHDDLTGLLNRSVIEGELASRLADPEAKVALFLVDIDHFKRINDTRGHEVGDEVLKEAGRRFAAITRGTDLTIRMGGDEFLLIADFNVVDAAALEGFAQRLHAAFGADFTGPGWTQRVRISVGVAVGPDHGGDAATLIRHADMALYEAKGQGRSRSAIFDRAVESRIQLASAMELEIERALRDGEFSLFYQPKVDLRTLRVVGLEALVRWRHPMRGLLGPDQFIALAEANGQIDRIGRWVIDEAASQLSRWREQGLEVWPVAVNVSFIQIVNQSLVPDVRASCARWGIPLAWLELELTETVAMENTPQSFAVLEELAALGVKISLDDFGTGYSSLAHVRQLPVDCLKIDRSFVGNLESDPHSVVVTKGVIGMAHGLNLTTVAEGVETRAQLRWLVEHHCDIGQGYLFSRPVPAGAVAQAVGAIESASWA